VVGWTAVIAGVRLFDTGTPWVDRCDPACDGGGYDGFCLPLAGPVGGPRDLNRCISSIILGVFQNDRKPMSNGYVRGDLRVVLVT
jgi:hypothetical protein